MKKKICFVISSPLTARAFLLKHFEYLSEQFEIYLVANFDEQSANSFSKKHVKDIKNIEIHRDISIFKDFKSLVILRAYLKKMNFEAVHTVTPKAGLIGMFASKLASIKIRVHIFTGQVWHTKTGLFKYFLMTLDRFIVWCSTDILVDGESQRGFLIKNKIVNNTNSFVLGKGSISGVDLNRFVPSDNIKNEVRDKLKISKNEVVYMFLGRMNFDKGINELAHAFNSLQKNHSNVRLLLVGGDEENMKTVIEDSVENIKSVLFYGVTQFPERLLQACDVFCLPSYREGFGTSVIEASLLEKPVVCSDTYGLMETIIDNKTGLRHKVADVNSLFVQMEKLVNNKELRDELGKSGRTYVMTNFSSDRISREWVKFYKNKLDV